MGRRWVHALPPGFLGRRLSSELALAPGGEEEAGAKRYFQP